MCRIERWPALDDVRIVRQAASRGAVRRSAKAISGSSAAVGTHAEALTVLGIDGEVVRNAVHDGTGGIDDLGPQQAPHHSAARLIHRDATRESVLDGEVRGVVGGDQHAALRDELLKLRESVVAESRANVIGLRPGADVRRLRRVLPRHRVPPARHALDDALARRPSGTKDDDVVFPLPARRLPDLLPQHLAYRTLNLTNPYPPPAFGLRALPRVHHGS